MKRKKILTINFIAIYTSIVFLGLTCIIQKPITIHAAVSKDTVSIQSADQVWIIKEVNGKKYKRLYNCMTKTWLTDWIPLD